jgi:small nuclear ribonucleoprotein (snRNP)-like protein
MSLRFSLDYYDVELKNGDTYNGRLVSCNMFMNIYLKDVICTSRVGTSCIFLNI